MESKELEAIDRFILDIASSIGDKKRTIELDELFSNCVSQLSYSDQEIIESMKKLFDKRYLVEGHRLTKEKILNNEKRQKIYKYIKENPGAHSREIRDVFKLGSYISFRHLKYLEIFGFLRSKKFLNKKAYFLAESDESQDEKILVFKNERTKIIYDYITTSKKVRISEIEESLNLAHGQIQPHLKKLIENDLIDAIIEDGITFYVPKIEKISEPITVK